MLAGEPYRAVILTAIETEESAIRAHLTDLHSMKCSHQMFYDVGTFTAQKQVWKVATRKTGQGNVPAAVETFHAIQHFDPAIILFVGIAGRLKEVKLGDVVIANEVYYYEPGRANASNYLIRSHLALPTRLLLELAQAEARQYNWHRRLKQLLPDQIPNVVAASVASGESVVASTRSPTYKFLAQHFSEAKAVEMEGYGFLLAASYHPEVQALLIRGISDRLSGKQRTEADNRHKIAAHHASAFAFEVLSKVDITDLQRSKPPPEPTTHSRPITTDSPGTPPPVNPANHSKPDIQKPDLIPQTPPTAPPMDDFLASLKRYQDRISELLPFFSTKRKPLGDQCKRVKQWLTELKVLLQEHRQDFQSSDPTIDFTIQRLSNMIETLPPQLDNLRFLLPQSQTTDDIQREIYGQLRQLLNTLKQLISILPSR